VLLILLNPIKGRPAAKEMQTRSQVPFKYKGRRWQGERWLRAAGVVT